VLGGAKDAVKKARTMIEALLKDSAKGPTLEKGHVVETIDLPAYAVGSIIGKGGSNIKALEADTGASIDIQRGDGDVCGGEDQCDP
jgi:polyribonucleotide nucleotidyltransferase